MENAKNTETAKNAKTAENSANAANAANTANTATSNAEKYLLVFGHKNPDLDSICAAIAYAEFKKISGTSAKAMRLGDINSESQYALKKFGIEPPELLSDAEGKTVALVDHNELAQSARNIAASNIAEVIDHHRIAFSWPKPIYFHAEAVGSTSTIVAELYFKSDAPMTQGISGLLLAAIISDTVAFKSPTTTQKDKDIAKTLSETSGIKIEDLAAGIIEKKTALEGLTALQILNKDLKEYTFGGKKFAIGQIELANTAQAAPFAENLLKEMNFMLKLGYYGVALACTDIIKGETEMLYVGEGAMLFEKACGQKFRNSKIPLPGIISRKAQLVPLLEKAFA